MRFEGYDLARALAILGMVFINLRLVLQLMGENVYLGREIGLRIGLLEELLQSLWYWLVWV